MLASSCTIHCPSVSKSLKYKYLEAFSIAVLPFLQIHLRSLLAWESGLFSLIKKQTALPENFVFLQRFLFNPSQLTPAYPGSAVGREVQGLFSAEASSIPLTSALHWL